MTLALVILMALVAVGGFCYLLLRKKGPGRAIQQFQKPTAPRPEPPRQALPVVPPAPSAPPTPPSAPQPPQSFQPPQI